MLDFTSLILAAGLFLGLVVGDAALYGDPLQVQITLPPKLTQVGFTEAVVEQVFAAEVATIGQAVSIAPTPSVQMSSRPTVLAALGKPLNLDNVVVALQSRFGMQVMTVNGTVTADPAGPRLDMVMVVVLPHAIPTQIRLVQEDGDVVALIRHGAELALERISPYRVALTAFSQGLAGDTASFARARDTAARAIARPWEPDRASERLMLHNLLALVALVDGDVAGAKSEFLRTDPIPGALPAAHGTVAINRAFLAVAAKQPTEARQWFKMAKEQTTAVQLPGWKARMDMLAALVAWSAGDTTGAEELLRSAIALEPQDEGPRAYLAQLLAAKGDATGADAERTAATTAHQFDIEIPSLAQSVFWVDPVNGGFKRRG